MGRSRAGRQANGRSTIYKGNDGYWHGRVTVGIRQDGHPDRRHVMSRHKSTVAEKVRDLEHGRNTGSLLKPGEKWTVEEWLTHWLEDITAPFVKVNTLAGYRVAVNYHLIPGVGKHKLTELRPEHLERLYQEMMLKETKGGTLTKAATAHQVHRTVRTALNEAVRRGYLGKNPAVLAKTPRVDEDEVEPYTVDEIQSLFRTATQTRSGARWAIALALGLRQGDRAWVFATETGAPLNPRTDWGHWKRLLKSAGIRDSRLHDARHTAATVLLLLGVSERTMMGVMGWSNPAMAQRYAHMADPIRRDIATRVGGLLWGDEPGAAAQ